MVKELIMTVTTEKSFLINDDDLDEATHTAEKIKENIEARKKNLLDKIGEIENK
jgi:hypothetical protein